MINFNSYYTIISFLYDKSCNLISPFLSMFSNGIYMPNCCDIEIIIVKSNFNVNKHKDIRKLINSIESNLDIIKSLLLSRFRFGASRFISMFDQRQLKFINGKLKIYIRNRKDILNFLKIWFLISNENNADKFIDRLDIFNNLNSNIFKNDLLIDISSDIYEYINFLLKKEKVPVICKSNDKLYICNVSSIDLINLISKHSLVLLNILDSSAISFELEDKDKNIDFKVPKYIFCIDNGLYEYYNNMFENINHYVVSFDLSLINLYCMYLDRRFIINLKRIYANNIEDLLSKNFKFNINVDNIFTSCMRDGRYFMSDIIFDNNFSYDKSDHTFVSSQRAINYGLDIYGISGRNNIHFSTNKLALNFGIEMCMNRDISISNMICDIQEGNLQAWFCKNNKSLSNLMNINNGFFDKLIKIFLVLTNSSVKIFDRNYIHGFSNGDEIAIVYNCNRWPVRKILDYSVLRFTNFFNLNFDNNIKSFCLNNFIHNISNKNILINKDSIEFINLLGYESDELLNISHMLDLYGYRNTISYSSILSPLNLINSIFSTKFVQFLYRIDNASSFAIRFMSKSLGYKNLVLNRLESQFYLFNAENDVFQVILENYCLLPVYSMIINFESTYLNYEIEASKVISQRVYADKTSIDVFSDTSIIKFNINSNILFEKLYLKGVSFNFSNLFFINIFYKNSYAYTFLVLNKKLSDVSFIELNFGAICNSFSSLSLQNIKIINLDKSPNFLMHNAMFLLRNPNICNKIDFDFMTSLSYNRYCNKKDIFKFEIISDMLAYKFKSNKLCIDRFFDIDLSYSKHIILLPNIGSLYLVINLKLIRDNLSFLSFKFINNVY